MSGWVFRATVLSLSSALLWLIYGNPPLILKDSGPPNASPIGLVGPGKDPPQFLLDEHKKVTDEIKTRIEEENELFRYKFSLVGALLAAFLARIWFQGDSASNSTPDERVEQLLDSGATSSVLTLACVIAVSIDIHIRTATIVTNQLGLWIAQFIEPAAIRQPFQGYENFLRGSSQGAGMHGDGLYGFMYWPPLHFLTWIVYLLYLSVLQNVCSRHTGKFQSMVAGFLVVHFSIGAFAWMGIRLRVPFNSTYSVTQQADSGLRSCTSFPLFFCLS
jgi:hypothetical protein